MVRKVVFSCLIAACCLCALISLLREASAERVRDLSSRLSRMGVVRSRSRSLTSKGPYSSCDLSSTSCALDTLDGPTLIYTGGDTRCINADAYAFAVVPGSPDKVLYYFQGGGACWEAEGVTGKKHQVWQCTDSLQAAEASSGLGHGVQDFQNDKNPFKNYTVVNALYCSGDVFMGNTSMSGRSQHGYMENLAVLSWSKNNFPHRLSSFVIAGTSAGGLGVRIWAETLLRSFTYKNAAVLVDSQAGFFPGNSGHRTMARWGVCETTLVPAELRSSCLENITIHDVYRAAMAKFPSVPFGTIQSKYDRSQIWFAEKLGRTWGSGVEVAAENYVEGVNRILEDHSKYANHKVFLINGNHHTYLGDPAFWSASPAGTWQSSQSPLLHEWVGKLISSEPHVLRSHCLEVLGDNLTRCPKSASGEDFP